MSATVEGKVVKLDGGETKMFDEIIKCSNGFFNVRRLSRYAYLNKDGENITPFKYEAPADFREGFAVVKYNREYLRLDEAGVEHHF